jgi:hypothetical protein
VRGRAFSCPPRIDGGGVISTADGMISVSLSDINRFIIVVNVNRVSLMFSKEPRHAYIDLKSKMLS